MAGYSYAPQRYYYTTPEVQHTETSHVPNNYCASTTNSHVDVARNNDNVHIASAIKHQDLLRSIHGGLFLYSTAILQHHA